MKVEGFNHLFNPFSQGPVKLKKWQKGVAITSLVVLAPLLLFPGLIAFWGLTYYFKATQLKLYEQDHQSTANRTNSVSTKTLPTRQRDHSSIKDPTLSSPTQSRNSFLLSKGDNSLPTPLSDLAESKQLLQEELERFHASSDTQKYLQILRSSVIVNKIALLEKIKEQSPNWPEYLRYLYFHEPKDFHVLFGVVLEDSSSNEYLDFVRALDQQLDAYLEAFNHCQVISGDQILLTHQALLRYINHSFFANSEEQEATNFPAEECERLKETLNSYLFDKRLKISEENLTAYLDFALNYDIPLIREECKKWILENLEDIGIDAIELFEIADQYDLESIKSELAQTLIQMHQENTGWSQLQSITLEKWLPRINHLEIYNDLHEDLEPLLNFCTRLHSLKIKIYKKETINLLKKFPKLQKIELIAPKNESDYILDDEDLKNLQALPISLIE